MTNDVNNAIESWTVFIVLKVDTYLLISAKNHGGSVLKKFALFGCFLSLLSSECSLEN